MNEKHVDTEHAFAHTLTVFSVSSGMIGVCLTAIGLVKIVSQAKGRRDALRRSHRDRRDASSASLRCWGSVACGDSSGTSLRSRTN